MAFKTKVESIIKVKVDGKPSISYRRRKTKKRLTPNPDTPPALIIGVPSVLLSKFKNKDGDRYVLMLGDGPDAKKAMIVKDKDGACKAAHFGRPPGCFSFRFGYLPMMGMNAAEKEFVEVVAETADSITITLPAWFKADK